MSSTSSFLSSLTHFLQCWIYGLCCRVTICFILILNFPHSDRRTVFGVGIYGEPASGLLQPVMVGDSLQDTGMSGQRQLVGSSPDFPSFTDFTCYSCDMDSRKWFHKTCAYRGLCISQKYPYNHQIFIPQ